MSATLLLYRNDLKLVKKGEYPGVINSIKELRSDEKLGEHRTPSAANY